MASLIVKITGDASGFKSVTDGVGRGLDSISTRAEKVSGALGSLGNSLSIGLTLPAVAAGAAAVRAAADFEKLNKGLASIMGSTQAGAAEFRKLQDAAKLPGLGLEQAVAGSIRLQVLGNSADKSRKIMAELGNAIALVGGGKDDFAEVTRQLGQMLSVGKVTKENLDTITERIPQISKIMIDTFGPQSVGDPAKYFEKAGISSRQFVDIIIGKLSEGARAGDTFANKMGNLEESVKIAAASVGEKLIPTIEKLIPKIESLALGITGAVDSFTKLPDSVQAVTVGFVGLAIAAGPALRIFSGISTAIVGMNGYLLASGTALAAAGGAAAANTSTFAAMSLGVAALTLKLTAVASAAYLAYAGFQLFSALGKESESVNNLSFSTEKLLERVRKVHPEIGALELRYRNGTVSLQEFNAEVLRLARGMYVKSAAIEAVIPKVNELGEGISKSGEKSAKAAKHHIAASVATLDMAIAHKQASNRMEEYNKTLDRAADLGIKYNAVTYEQIRLNIQAADAAFRYFRVLEQAPDLGGITAGIKVPVFSQPKFGDKPFEGGAPNVGDGGMMSKEQAERLKREAREVAAAQSTAARAVSLAVNDLARGLSKAVLQWKGFGAAGKEALSNIGEFLLRSAFEKQLERIGNQIIKLTADTGALGKVLSAVFGGGSSVVGNPVIKNAVGGASQVGNASGGIGAAAGAASSGIASIVGAVAQVGTMISSIVGNFQFMAMNKTLDLVEKEVRYSQIHLLYTLEKANEYWPYMKSCWESLVRMEQRGAGLAGGVQVNMAGSYLLTDSALDDFIERIARQLKNQGI